MVKRLSSWVMIRNSRSAAGLVALAMVTHRHRSPSQRRRSNSSSSRYTPLSTASISLVSMRRRKHNSLIALESNRDFHRFTQLSASSQRSARRACGHIRN